MFSFLRSLHTSQPSSLKDHPTSQPSLLKDHPVHPTSQPSSLKDDPPSRLSHIARFPELPRPDLYPGPIDVAPADMPEELFHLRFPVNRSPVVRIQIRRLEAIQAILNLWEFASHIFVTAFAGGLNIFDRIR
jgi:hypothetical protein